MYTQYVLGPPSINPRCQCTHNLAFGAGVRQPLERALLRARALAQTCLVQVTSADDVSENFAVFYLEPEVS